MRSIGSFEVCLKDSETRWNQSSCRMWGIVSLHTICSITFLVRLIVVNACHHCGSSFHLGQVCTKNELLWYYLFSQRRNTYPVTTFRSTGQRQMESHGGQLCAFRLMMMTQTGMISNSVH